MTAKEKINIIQAQEAGKTIQARVNAGSERHVSDNYEMHGYQWFDCIFHHFNFGLYEYRVKPDKPTSVRLNDEFRAVKTGGVIEIWQDGAYGSAATLSKDGLLGLATGRMKIAGGKWDVTYDGDWIHVGCQKFHRRVLKDLAELFDEAS